MSARCWPGAPTTRPIRPAWAASGNTGLDWANEYNTIQSYAIDHSRLHIPVIFGVDAVHGFGHPWQAPLFPQSIGMGATWDPAAAQAGGATTANALRATGWVWDFAPVQDLSRDNRWGRTYETWAEEPVLSAAMGGANVQGLQTPGTANSLNVTATVKHFAGYSQSVNGHDRNEALLPLSYLQSMILPSYAGGIDAGAGTVMVDSGSINGVPATASHYLLTDILRNQMGFQGVVISDYQDVPALQTAYHIAPDLAGAIAKAVNAGVDMSMEVTNPDQWQTAILQDVATGAISKARIDQAVRRILTLKFQLGLFDQPCVNDPSVPCVNANAADAAVTAGRDHTLKAAHESITLLRNQGNALPLSPSSQVVVTGPSADSMTNQLGGWSVSWQGVFGAGHVCCMGPANQIPPGTTVQQGIHGRRPNAVFAPDQATALADAGTASAYVVAVGEKAYAEGLGDNPAPQLPPDQQALIAALEGTGKPVIVVVIAGRPVGLGPAAENANGVLMAYQGSTEAGQAVADAIFGKVNPSGKLLGQLAVGRPHGGRGLQRRRAVAAGRPAQVLRPAARHRLRPGPRLQPAVPLRLRPVVHHLPDQQPVGDAERVQEQHRHGHVHGDQHREPCRHRHRPGLREPAGQQRGGAAAAVGRLHQGRPRRRSVKDRARFLPGLHAGRDAGRHQCVGTAQRRTRCLHGATGQERHDAVRRRRLGPVHHHLTHSSSGRRADALARRPFHSKVAASGRRGLPREYHRRARS